MKKFNKRLMALVVIIMLVNLMAPTANVVHAGSRNQVTVSIPARDFCSTYDAYPREWISDIDKNKIKLYVNSEEFPVYATLSSKHGKSKKYTFDTYGEKKLEVDNGSPIFPEYAYITIIIAKPTQESNASSNSIFESESKESKFDSSLTPLRDKMDFGTSNYLYADSLKDKCIKDIADYKSGVWDGTIKSKIDDNVYGTIASRDIIWRTYRWRGSNYLNGESYNDIDMNIDYIGNLPIEVNEVFTLAIDYSSGIIEKWEFLEKTDSWKVPIENESIERVFLLLNPGKDECQADVFTVDEKNNKHLYLLMPNGQIIKAN